MGELPRRTIGYGRKPDNEEERVWHRAKHRTALEYIDIADKLERRYPHLKPLYRIGLDKSHGDSAHVSLDMRLPDSDFKLLIQALYRDEELPDDLDSYSFDGDHRLIISTNINIGIRALAADRDYTDLCDRIRERQVEQARFDFGE